jgi:type VI protein secretion system component VasK
VETFGHAAPKTRAAPWGFGIDDKDETALASSHRFDALLDTLRGYSMSHLSAQDSRATRAPLYLFPQYVGTLRRGLMQAVEATFGTQSRPTGPRLGGIYFVATPQSPKLAAAAGITDHPAIDLTGPSPLGLTSAVPPGAALPAMWQEEQLLEGGGTLPALDVVAAVQSPQTPQQAAYFVRGLMDDVLAHDSALMLSVRQPGLKGELVRAPLQVALAAGMALVLAVTVASFAASMAHIKRLGQVVAMPWDRQDAEAKDGLTRLMDAVHSEEGGPGCCWASTVGFGAGAARAPLAALYVRLLERELISHVLASDTRELQAAWRRHAYAGTAPEQQEATLAMAQLRTHLLLTGPKAAHEPALTGRQGEWLIRSLGGRLMQTRADGDDEGAALIHKHLHLYVRLLSQYPELLPKRDQALVSRARALLQRRPLADLLIDGLTYDIGMVQPSVRLDDIMTSGVVPLMGRVEVPAAFTGEGYNRHAKAWLQAQETDTDAWIFWEAPPALAQRRQTVRLVRSRYYNRYIEAWRDFVSGLVWQEPTDAHGGHVMLVALTRSEPPPLRALWRAMAQNTQLGADADGAAAAADGVLGGLRRRLALAQDGLGGHSPRSNDVAGPQDVAHAFAPLLAFGGAQAQPDTEREQKAPLGTYQDLIQELRGATEAYLEAPQEGEALMQQLRRTRTQATGLIQTAAAGSGARAVLQQLLIVPLEHMTRALTRGARAQVLDLWCPAVVGPFAQLRQRYPFDPAGPDASLEDVAAFFHPKDGQPWQFYQEHLKNDVLQKVDTFAFDDKMGGVLKRTFRPQLLHFYSRLLATSRALFADGHADTPGVDVDVRLTMDKELWETRLEAEGVTLHVAPGQSATSWQRLHWPAKGAPASLVMVGVGGVKERLDFEGPWALWHLIESGQVRLDRATGIVTVTFRPGGILGHARVDLRPNRAANLFFLNTQGPQGGVFGYLRDPALAPPRIIGAGQRPCPL